MKPAQQSIAAWALAALLGPQYAGAQTPDDARFRENFQRRYTALKAVAPDMVVMELRDRVELVASRGSQVGAASTERRVRGFESELLRGLQATHCEGAAPGAARPTPGLVDKVSAAADTQRLRTQGDDLAELSAFAQRLLDSQPRERWCKLKSLDEVR